MISDSPPAAEVVERIAKEASALLAGSNVSRVRRAGCILSKITTGPGLVSTR